MRRCILAFSLAAFILSGCSPVAEVFAGEDEAPEETTPEGVAPVEESPELDGSVEETPEAETSADDGWDETVRTNFYESCLSTSANATGYCQCALDGLQERFSQEDLEAFEQQMTSSVVLPAEFDEVIDVCLEEHRDAIVGSDEPAEHEWSPSAQSEFLFGCIDSSGGMINHCECTLDGLQEIYTESEFEQLSLELERGESTPPEFDGVVDACFEQHG